MKMFGMLRVVSLAISIDWQEQFVIVIIALSKSRRSSRLSGSKSTNVGLMQYAVMQVD